MDSSYSVCRLAALSVTSSMDETMASVSASICFALALVSFPRPLKTLTSRETAETARPAKPTAELSVRPKDFTAGCAAAEAVPTPLIPAPVAALVVAVACSTFAA